MQEQMSNVSREIKTLRKNFKNIPKIKMIVTEMKNVFDELINVLNMANERTSELEEISMKFPKFKSKKE